MRISYNFLLALLPAFLAVQAPLAALPVTPTLPSTALTAQQLGVIVNESDPDSVVIAEYYRSRRGIPESNMLSIRFPPGNKTLPVAKFNAIKQQLDKQTPAHIQAYVLTWTQPYRVGCMSITTAFAAGFDSSFCAKGCQPTQASPYFNSSVAKPYDRFRWRPTMLLTGHDVTETKALIERGVAADYSHPHGTAYLVKTSEKARGVRARYFPAIKRRFANRLPVKILQQDYISDRKDILFYFTGKKQVEKIRTNVFLPGAAADHLTSGGGNLIGGKQMSILEWVAAGATGSYGTVTEPCNYVQKFPHPAILMHFYLGGSSLLEAYWKSVAWPGQGLFVGEPLAKPFATRP